jgi:hypothetical protein
MLFFLLLSMGTVHFSRLVSNIQIRRCWAVATIRRTLPTDQRCPVHWRRSNGHVSFNAPVLHRTADIKHRSAKSGRHPYMDQIPSLVALQIHLRPRVQGNPGVIPPGRRLRTPARPAGTLQLSTGAEASCSSGGNTSDSNDRRADQMPRAVDQTRQRRSRCLGRLMESAD